jgi:hypothetical protein|tara:strand:- start:387 stop:776 length:390 start_codon:yes stop_codon:yes gene_type:complete
MRAFDDENRYDFPITHPTSAVGVSEHTMFPSSMRGYQAANPELPFSGQVSGGSLMNMPPALMEQMASDVTADRGQRTIGPDGREMSPEEVRASFMPALYGARRKTMGVREEPEQYGSSLRRLMGGQYYG